MKILTVCQGGNSRSVALGYLLKYKLGHDALACSWERNSRKTLMMLCRWAERIIVMEIAFAEKIPASARDKVSVYDVGPDVWCNSLHPQLLALLEQYLAADPLMKEALV